jgi:PTH1 family peptidyl-tRNA hydrolase
MNLSGESVREILSFYKISFSDLLVIYDDYDLVKGEIRIRQNGSSGTHNGMRNIVKEIGTVDFSRIRIGFKPEEENKIPLINYVLSGIKQEDKPLFEKAIESAGNAAALFAKGEKLDLIMQKYNGKTQL